ncbi:MAG TPA: Na/Pi cotransporter family protein, partial [Candidatus Tenderia electrophaga]|nr:Na/Pi cotransporter family protein [Candidatus Tenderia electrophaga]
MDLGIGSSLIGGIGLFLLGMFLMTNGLRLAAGHALQNILERWTRTTLRGILTGISITSLVQSSSAVTVATLGFVNAGLMQLKQAITVIYGSNIGTTMTAWLVALVGFHVDIKLFALPAIGIGMAMRLLWNNKRLGAFGEALAGFGVFFLGIEILKTGFEGMGGSIQFANLEASGLDMLLLVGSGFLMTVLMQSSSASMTIILTAAGGAVIPLPAAAAMIIGANVGTTSTALLAVIGATANAKRVAAAHVCFNLLTGLVAILILPWMLSAVQLAQLQLGYVTDTPMILALFHSLFNILGVLLLWPFTNALVRALKLRFRSNEEDKAKPRHLDQTLLGTPVLAFQALGLELQRIADIGRKLAKGAISAELGPSGQLLTDRHIQDQLVIAAGEYCTSLQKTKLPAELAEALPNAIRVGRYYSAVSHLAEHIAAQQQHHSLADTELAEKISHFKSNVVQLIEAADVSLDHYSSETCTTALAKLQDDYQSLKSTLLRGGTEGHIKTTEMVVQLEMASQLRRLAEQIEKGARYLASFQACTPAEQ